MSVPLQNIVETGSWTKGNHNVSFGGEWRQISNNSSSNANSFSGASTNPSWLATGDAPDPTTLVDAGGNKL